MAEIAENDYNLNIPRYVDTFEEEEPIDLDEVAERIKGYDQELSGINDEIKKNCEELGIKTPF